MKLRHVANVICKLVMRTWIVCALVLICARITYAADGCVARPDAFDGIRPLAYKRVKNDLGEKAEFRATCVPVETRPCKPHALISGDVVAVANSCGDLSYVQHIGENSVTVGWIRASRLETLRPTKSDEEGSSNGNESRAIKLRFKLIEGNGVPVCEAYLQRLNRTSFRAPEYCGRPENSSVPGFDKLNRVYLSTAEVNAISNTGIGDNFSLSTWRYDPPIDVDNDGRPDNVIVWNLDDPQDPHCGLDSGGSGGLDTGFQLLMILGTDNRSVDQRRTRDLFESRDPHAAEKLDVFAQGNGTPLIRDFLAYGTSYSLFRYRGVTYFDTSIRTKSEQANLSLEPRDLQVFLIRERKTKGVCTLRTF